MPGVKQDATVPFVGSDTALEAMTAAELRSLIRAERAASLKTLRHQEWFALALTILAGVFFFTDGASRPTVLALIWAGVGSHITRFFHPLHWRHLIAFLKRRRFS